MRRLLGTLAAGMMLVAVLPVAAVADEHGACGASFTPIYEIQGDGDDSPLDGEVVVTEGVVTVDLQGDDQLSGFFIQDLYGDGDSATSDGIFVSHRDTWSPSFDPRVGHVVRVQGTVDEQFGNTQVEFVSEASICGRQRVAPLQIDARTYNADNEAYEGMYLGFVNPLGVTDTFNLHRFGEVWLGESTVVEQPTNEYSVGPDAEALAADNMARSFLLDDSSTESNPEEVPYLSDGETLRLGDTTSRLSGAIFFSFSQYRVMPQNPGQVDFVPTNLRPAAPDHGGSLTVASFNVLNYWTTLGERGADTADQLAVQTEKLVAAILAMDADVVALQEVENDLTHTPILTLLDALNATDDVHEWAWIGELDYYNLYPIRNEIIYRADRVTAVGDPVTVADPAFDEIPDGRDDPLGRPPVAQTFDYGGEVFTVVNNHFKSKSCSGAEGDNDDQDDGQACWNPIRIEQAEVVLDLVGHMIRATRDRDVLVVGDLNSYMREDPILTFEERLVNLVTAYDADPYSFNFFASFSAPWIGRGSLDHAFATRQMAHKVGDTYTWHINADEPRFLDWFDPSRTAPGPYRSSDHDPVLIVLDM
ncbi:MAG TPA: ExeM/NucH family extracellular endonuclease [Acidimicrobiia bacterium]|nr:ExeM/NucH family extracellular endonuclease [Acidimicrobiia bacterium]